MKILKTIKQSLDHLVVNPVFYNPSDKSECTNYPHNSQVKGVKLLEIAGYEMGSVKFITLSPNPFP